MAEIFEQEQSLHPNPVVYLYQLDFSFMKGGTNTVAYWTPYRNGTQDIVYNGQTYTYMGINMTGLDMEAGGKLPSPRLQIFTKINDPFFYKALTEDVRGIRVTRLKTYANFLQGGADAASPKARETVFYINGLDSRVVSRMTFRLSTNYGLEGVNNKANRVLNTFTCILKYRVWNPATNSFSYTAVKDGGCPWGNPAEQATWGQGVNNWGGYFTANDEATGVASQDKCSLSATGCTKRFAADDPNHILPYTADPKGFTKNTGGCTK